MTLGGHLIEFGDEKQRKRVSFETANIQLIALNHALDRNDSSTSEDENQLKESITSCSGIKMQKSYSDQKFS